MFSLRTSSFSRRKKIAAVSARDVALRPYVAVFIAYNISKMIAAVEQSGNLCRRGFAGIVFFVIFFVVILVFVFVFAAAAVVLFAKDIGVGDITADAVFFGIRYHIPMTGGVFIACGRNHVPLAEPFACGCSTTVTVLSSAVLPDQ